jgi:DNA-directed RNA polymerase specialized sigma24 family protein
MPSPFDEFLFWLSPDREEAGRKYVDLRKRVVKYFTWGGCHVPEELTDVTIDRASKSIAESKVDHSVDPNAYCFGIARNVLREYRRSPQPDPLPDNVIFVKLRPDWNEREVACLDKCLAELSEYERDLVTSYHQHKGSEKIRKHKEIAEKEGGMNALRLRIHRIKNTLRDCVSACLRREPGNLM